MSDKLAARPQQLPSRPVWLLKGTPDTLSVMSSRSVPSGVAVKDRIEVGRPYRRIDTKTLTGPNGVETTKKLFIKHFSHDLQEANWLTSLDKFFILGEEALRCKGKKLFTLGERSSLMLPRMIGLFFTATIPSPDGPCRCRSARKRLFTDLPSKTSWIMHNLVTRVWNPRRRVLSCLFSSSPVTISEVYFLSYP